MGLLGRRGSRELDCVDWEDWDTWGVSWLLPGRSTDPLCSELARSASRRTVGTGGARACGCPPRMLAKVAASIFDRVAAVLLERGAFKNWATGSRHLDTDSEKYGM